jgi:anti-anti-sigma factor
MAVLTAHGEIDLSNADAFAGELAAALPEQGRLTVDLTDVEYLDSAGLTALFAQADRIEVIVTALLAPTLAISGLSDVAIVHVRSE